MAKPKLTYVGPVKEVGLRTASGNQYVVRPGEPFDVSAEDANELLSRYPGLITEVRAKRKESDDASGNGTEAKDQERQAE